LIEDANRVLTELTPATAEVQTEDGTWYNRRILPYRTQDDGSEGVVITFADITELKQLTEAIRESRAKLQAAFASMTEAIFVADAEGRLIDFNDEFVRYHRFRDREECSRTIADCPKYLDVWFPNGTPAPLEQWAMPRALRGETASNVEYRLRRKETGETWWGSYNFAPIKDQNGRISDAVVAASEITERKAAEEALRLSEEKFARAFAENPTAVGMTRLEDGVFVDVNDTFLAMTGWSREEAVGHSAREMHIWPTAEAARRFVDELKGKGSLRGWEQEFYKKSGETFVGQLWATVLTVRGEKVILSTVVDITERKQAEKALRQSREDLDRAQAVGQIGSWRLDLRRNVLIWSDETHRIFGIPKGTPLTYEAFLATIHPDDRNYVDIRWNAGLRGEPYDIEHRIVADGKVRWVREKAYLEFDDAGQLLGGFGIAQDITERKQAKEALQQLNAELEQRILERTAELVKAGERIKSERQRLFDVLETLPAMICLLTPDYHVAFANRGFRERFGKSNGRHCYEYCFGLSQPCEFCETYKVLETGQPHRWEVNSPDGSVIAAYDFPFTDVDGSPMILEMDIDITEQRRTEEALRHAGDYNRSLIEASLDPLVTIGPDGRITDVNAAAEQITGFGRKELVGTDFSEYFTEPERAQAGYRQVFREGVVRDYPLEIRHRNGQTTPVLYNTSVYRDADGKGIGVFAAARDVTERKRAETALRELNETLERRVAERTEELARSNEDLQQFAYVASHDLQEPLRMVNGFLQLLEERYKQQLDDKAREYIRYSAEGATRMSNLIHDLLEYSRVERKEGGHKPVDASLALSGAMANLRSAIEQANATMTYEQLPAVMGDPTHLMQLFQNLIGNAIKFCSPERPCQIHVGAQHRDGWWVFYVRDNGIGIPKEAFDRIFVIFQRLHMREKYTGTGIGLSICKKIAEQHGGRIWVESEPGQGATFYFSLREA
jgi:PAS domain S-box-containing protein